MPLLTRLFKSPGSRAGVAASAHASADASLPHSTTSGDNSRGTSKTSAELIAYMNGVFDELDAHESMQLNAKHLAMRLIGRAAKFANCGLPEGVGEEWKPRRDQLHLLDIAVRCSANVYEASGPAPHLPGFVFDVAEEIAASWDGVTKATKFFVVTREDWPEQAEQTGEQRRQEESCPLLVVAIRGTKAVSLDWSVNLNREIRDAGPFFSFADVLPADQLPAFQTDVHAGFLHGARALEPAIRAQIQLCRSRDPPVRDVLFTGHSAGGAVASLAFMHVLGTAKREFPDLRFFLVTFGSPPATARQLTPYVDSLVAAQARPGMALAVVNEHDVIARADGSYVRSLADLYNEYGAAAVATTSSTDPPLGGSLDGSVGRASRAAEWKLPPAELHVVGDVVVLKDTSPGDGREIHAFRVDARRLESLVFCDRAMHPKKVYLDHIADLVARETQESQRAAGGGGKGAEDNQYLARWIA